MTEVHVASRRRMSRVDVWLAGHVGLAGQLRYELLAGGRSKSTMLVTDERGRRVVLRLPATSTAQASASNVIQEARIMAALRYTGVPVAPILAISENADVAGVPLFAMAYVDGDVIDSPLHAGGYSVASRRHLGFGLVEVLAQLQKVELAAVGVPRMRSSAAPYLVRECRQWNQLWQSNATRDLPAIDDVGRRLATIVDRLEPQPECLVHGDLRFGNFIVENDLRPRIAAVLDWQLAARGHPLADLAWLGARMQAPPGAHECGLDPSSVDGFPSFDELVAHFVSRTQVSIADLPVLVAFHAWRWSIICAGVHARMEPALTPQMREIEQWNRRRVEVLANYAAELMP